MSLVARSVDSRHADPLRNDAAHLVLRSPVGLVGIFWLLFGYKMWSDATAG